MCMEWLNNCSSGLIPYLVIAQGIGKLCNRILFPALHRYNLPRRCHWLQVDPSLLADYPTWRQERPDRGKCGLKSFEPSMHGDMKLECIMATVLEVNQYMAFHFFLVGANNNYIYIIQNWKPIGINETYEFENHATSFGHRLIKSMYIFSNVRPEDLWASTSARMIEFMSRKGTSVGFTVGVGFGPTVSSSEEITVAPMSCRGYGGDLVWNSLVKYDMPDTSIHLYMHRPWRMISIYI